MDEHIANTIREQIDFLKSDLNCKYPDSELGARKMVEAREMTKQKILQLMDKLAGVDTQADDKIYYRQLLEKIATDRSAIDMAKDAVAEIDDDDIKEQVISNALSEYEATKRAISDKILEKLG